MISNVLGLRVDSERVVVSSRDLARVFEKNHQHVLRDVRELECGYKFRLSNFGQSSYLNEQGKIQPEYFVSRDGFVLLVMGYTGDGYEPNVRGCIALNLAMDY